MQQKKQISDEILATALDVKRLVEKCNFFDTENEDLQEELKNEREIAHELKGRKASNQQRENMLESLQQQIEGKKNELKAENELKYELESSKRELLIDLSDRLSEDKNEELRVQLANLDEEMNIHQGVLDAEVEQRKNVENEYERLSLIEKQVLNERACKERNAIESKYRILKQMDRNPGILHYWE